MTPNNPTAAAVAADAAAFSKRYDAARAEPRLAARWQEAGLHHYDPTRPRSETFVVDTPPPTVSGALHIGHVFSYTQTDVIARFWRMRGRNIFYPMGWDDNGVPTERRVQNLFHVRCDPSLPAAAAEAAADELQPATAKQRKKPARPVARRDFLALCARVTAADERAFCELFTRIGLSVDWRTEYTTISPRARAAAQHSFLELHRRGHAYTREAPFLWDVDFKMALSQADVVDREEDGAWYDIEFGVVGDGGGGGGDGDSFVVSTTRPELLPACVGVAVHPDDARTRRLLGRRARTPLFHAPVPIFKSPRVDPQKGSGVVMVCTFGDQTDVDWWREQNLPLRQVLGKDGRLLPNIKFTPAADADRHRDAADANAADRHRDAAAAAAAAFTSLDARAANDAYAELAGLAVPKARARVAELLAEPARSATGTRPALRAAPRKMRHALRFYEKGERPLEVLPSRQWFIRLLDKKAALLEKGARVRWHPPHMEQRFRDWTQNLALDWCVSRQRYFGVPIPVWYPLDERGERNYAAPLLASAAQLPVDPMTAVPAGFVEAQRGVPGGFAGEADIFDTWFTSALTPQISSGWPHDAERHARLFPADLRPQAHEIIRTWAFYTLAVAHLHEDKIPWRDIAISGWVLDPERKKMSKSTGNVVTPLPLIEQFSADPVRYWAASARLGVDTALDEAVFRVGRRLVTKLWNASKFVDAQVADGESAELTELDRAFLDELRALVAGATRDLENFECGKALAEVEQFFWSRFADNYLELVKARAREGDGSAVQTLRFALSVLLRLFAPVLPFVTEEIWSLMFAKARNEPFIHTAKWPSEKEFDAHAASSASASPSPSPASCFDAAVAAFAAVNRAKANAQVSQGREISKLTLRAHPETLAQLAPARGDFLGAARCTPSGAHTFTADAALDAGVFTVGEVEFVERAPREEKQ